MAKRDVLKELFGLEGKAALVTGASGGIGRALAVGLAGAGATVALHGRSEEQLAETRKEVEAIGGKCFVTPGDLRGVEQCKQLIASAHKTLGRLDVLVNCAGMNRRKPAVEMTQDDFDTIVDVNLRAVFFLSNAAHPIMKAQGGGKIIHVASLTTFIGVGTTSVYGVTKAGVGQLTKTQAVEWAKDNIQVNGIAPGFIRTPLTEKAVWQNPQRAKWLLDRIPAKRGGTPEDMMSTVLLMAGPGAAYLNGQTIAVDGGFLAGGSWDD